MTNNNLLYDINDKPKKWYEWIVYPLQQVFAVFVATVLISNICGTPVSSCLFGAGLGTIIYQLITGFKSPMFISSCGATVSAVCGALALNEASDNYLMVCCGGFIILLIYTIFAFVVKKLGMETLNKIFPPSIVGAVTMVIGLNLATFIFSYVNGDSVSGTIPTVSTLIAIFTMLVAALTAHYGKGFLKNIPFLIALIAGYILALCCGKVSFDAFSNLRWYPDFTFLRWSTDDWSLINLGKTTLYFVPVAVCALLEHYSDHKVLSNIIGTDLTREPGLHKTLLGDGVASAIGTVVCGLPNTSYGESIATTGFSRVASTVVITVAALIIMALSFIAPIGAFIQTIPSCVFGGCAMILYGYIASSGLKTLVNNKIDLENIKNLIIVSVVLTVGVSGIYLFDAAFAGVSLAMVLGMILNLILRDKKTA